MSQDRMHIGEAHEQRVERELRRRGWDVQPWGQGLFTNEIRVALQARKPVVLWRWIPDLVAAKGKMVYLVDPKSEQQTTGNVAIEMASTAAHSLMRLLGLPIVYVFEDLTCASVPELDAHAIGFRPFGSARGSGTPYTLYRVQGSGLPHIDDRFGSPTPWSHA